MSQVSKRAVSREVLSETFNSLFTALAKTSDAGAIAKILDDILTPTERVMIAKRVMAAILSDRGYTLREIGEILKMSTTTINAVRREIKKRGEGYRMIFTIMPKRARLDELADKAERVLRGVIPPVKDSKSSFRRWKQS